MNEFSILFMSRFQRNVGWTKALASATEVGVATQHHEILRLQQVVLELATTVGTLATMLGEAGVLDLVGFNGRVDHAIAAQRTAATNHGPTITCPRCNRSVPASLTVITADGPLCDVCATAAP